jgi:hypothetical protein
MWYTIDRSSNLLAKKLTSVNELEQARQERDQQFATFVEESRKATKHNLRAQAARAKYVLARDEVRALEREILAYGPIAIN